MYIYIYLHDVLLYLDDGEGMKHHKVPPVHACTCFESDVFPERPTERGYCKGKFLHTQTTSPKQSLTTMIRDTSVVAKLMQMVDANGGCANGGCKWFFGWKVFPSSEFFRSIFSVETSDPEFKTLSGLPTDLNIHHQHPITHFWPQLELGCRLKEGVPTICFIQTYLKLISTTLIISIRFLSKWRLLDSRSYTTDIICWVHWCSLCRGFLLLLIWMIVPPYLVQSDLYRRQTCSSKNGDLVFQLCPFLTKHIWGYLVFHLARCLVPNPVLDFLEKPMSTHKLFLSSANQRSCSYEELDSCISCASTKIVALGWCSQKDPQTSSNCFDVRDIVSVAVA